MRCRSIPLAPAIIGLILGPMVEQQLRRALAIAEGSPMATRFDVDCSPIRKKEIAR
jgi:TctA family transporter